jgi:hypothetical protein
MTPVENSILLKEHNASEIFDNFSFVNETQLSSAQASGKNSF